MRNFVMPLRLHPQVDFRYLGPAETFPACDALLRWAACASRKRLITPSSATRTSTGWPMLARHTSISAVSGASWESIPRAAENTPV